MHKETLFVIIKSKQLIKINNKKRTLELQHKKEKKKSITNKIFRQTDID